ncbi:MULTISPECIES: M23 family metallopeptidase [unclassified Pseudodesulfovibrio]|uniref:M23 family metallopeptidase n=1 Tax=unclassified Pseudodesulfovibrio TaxID=2661612 RepID=UPI0013E3DEBB|nr:MULTISPECIES: M23 family metallopeptidase [unclassified Pseudodesulfovibrio]MCJ2164485.1 M23 family metallopeptidase [Pseudodesulfovibrio sp. S3-i]
MVDVFAPEQVGIGKPFLVRISTWYPLENLRVVWNEKTVQPAVTWWDGKSGAMLLLGIGLRQDVGTYTLEVIADIWGHERRFSRDIEVVESAWGQETLSVPPKMVKPPATELARIEREREQVLAVLDTVSPERFWNIPFVRPVKGKMLSRFGLHRVFNGETKSRHTGLDFRAWEGTPLHAIAAGRVVLTGHFYYAGNAVWIDHGNGLISMSCHMSRMLVREGDMVDAGQKIGLSGATGRVNGAHLHLSIFALGQVVDPEVLFECDDFKVLE